MQNLRDQEFSSEFDPKVLHRLAFRGYANVYCWLLTRKPVGIPTVNSIPKHHKCRHKNYQNTTMLSNSEVNVVA